MYVVMYIYYKTVLQFTIFTHTMFTRY